MVAEPGRGSATGLGYVFAADVLRGTAQAGLAVALFAGRPAIWLFVLLAWLEGSGQAFFSPALSALTVEIAPREQLGNANALYGLAASATRIAGPALGGVLVALAGPAVVVAVDAASYLASVLALSLLRMPRPEKAEGEQATAGDRARRTLFADMAEGWSDFRSRSWLWVVTVQFAFFNHLLALPDIPMALHAAAGWVGAAAFACGAGAAVSNTFFGTALQQQVPPGRLARINSLTMFPAYGVGVIGYAIDGPLASVVGAPLVFGVGAVYGLVSSAVVLALPSVRNIRWREQEPESAPGPGAAGLVPSGGGAEGGDRGQPGGDGDDDGHG
jgi:MFS family permease